jgi:pimeloyl-ACP methyl ester carboxylesterase
LPGIAGELPIDRELVAGLVAGGVASDATIIDWTGPDRGVPALRNVARHEAQSRLLADRIVALHNKDPRTPITLVGHSGGTGVAVNALERLPEGVHVRTLVLLASALSPEYDLSAALRHVDGHAYSLHSRFDDWVLGHGTKAFGTYDRVYTEAAGKVGFTAPPTADPAAYAKLTQFPYDPAWTRHGNGGDHVGPTNRRFARDVLAELIQGRPPSTTRPTDTPETP